MALIAPTISPFASLAAIFSIIAFDSFLAADIALSCSMNDVLPPYFQIVTRIINAIIRIGLAGDSETFSKVTRLYM